MTVSHPVSGIALALGAGLLLFFSGAVAAFDTWLFDRLILLSPYPSLPSQHVVVVEGEREMEVREILDLAERLHERGARLAVFHRDSGEALDGATQAALRGWNAMAISDRASGGNSTDFPASPPPRDGIWRGVRPDPSATAALPGIVETLGLPSPSPATYLDFRVRRDGFQTIAADRVLGGDLPRSLVEGKVVLIGKGGPGEAMLTTPVHRGGEALSRLLFEATVLDALLRGGVIRIAEPSLQWGLALLLLGALGFVAWRRKLEHAAWIAFGGIVLVVSVAWFALWVSHWWLPPGKPVVLLGLAGGLWVSRRGAIQRSSMRRTMRNLAADVQERAGKESFLTASSPWKLIEGTLDRAFSFRPGFVLRADPNSGSLEAVSEEGEAAIAKGRDDWPFQAQIFKPVLLRPLETAIATALGVYAHPATVPGPADELAGEPLRILIAEDNPINLRVVKKMLRKLGHHAEGVGNGIELLQELGEDASKFDVILMDVQMPELDGVETTRRILEKWPESSQRPYIIALTADALRGDREKYLAVGMDDYLSKPLRTVELRRALSFRTDID